LLKFLGFGKVRSRFCWFSHMFCNLGDW